jgi:hypothetical protein
MIGDKTIYCLNSAAVGDLIASAPSIKYAIENFHKKSEYFVGIHDHFKPLFPFVPENRFLEVKADYDKSFTVRHLNMLGVGGMNCKLTPSRLKLTDYASIGLLGRVLPEDQLKYVPLPKVDVTHFGVDFTKSVIIMTTYRDKQRSMLASEIVKIAEYVASKGLTPVYAGKTGAISIWKNNLAKTDFEYPGFGIDLMDKTSLLELATIMSQAKAVVGMDSGPIHLAFTTDVPVVCGFTTVAPELRIPYRGLVKTEAVVPNIFCNFCESNWSLNSWNFQKCPRNMELAECVTKMSSDKFIKALHKLNIFNT